MITELEDKYLVLKWDDVNEYLNNTETRRLAMMLEKVSIQRAKHGKDPDKKYVIVSDKMPMFKDIEQLVLDYINSNTYTTIQEYIDQAVELVIQKERTKAIINATTKIASRKINVKDKS